MTKYYITEFKAEIKDKRNIAPGCTANDQEPEHIKEFEDLEKAREELKKYKTSIYGYPEYTLVTEYGITVHKWDEDEEKFVWTGDIDSFSEMNIPVKTADSHDLITTVHSYKEGEEFIYEYEKDHKDDEDFEYLEMAL